MTAAHPVPGDPDAVADLALVIRRTADAAEAIVGRLRDLDSSTTTTVWSGPAAEAFRRRLAEIGPATIRLAQSHEEASADIQRYGIALQDAQDRASRAATAAAAAASDHDVARRQQGAAATESASAAGRSAALAAQIAQARAYRASSVDPAYTAQLDTYLTRTEPLQQQAAVQQAAARRDEVTAAASASEAARRRSIAEADVRSAEEDQRAAARSLVAGMRSVTPSGGGLAGFFGGIAEGAKRTVDGLGSSVESIEKWLVKDYRHGDGMLKRWAKDYGWLRRDVGIAAHDVGKMATGLKVISYAADGWEAVQAVREQWEADERAHPGMSTAERLFRAIGAGVDVARLTLGNDLLATLAAVEIGAAAGAAVGSVAPVVGTLAGLAVGGLAGVVASFLLETGERRVGIDEQKAREYGADEGSRIYRELAHPSADSLQVPQQILGPWTAASGWAW